MASSFEIFFTLTCIAIAGMMIYFYIRARNYSNTQTSAKIVRGMNGMGNVINLSCPSGTKITVNKANVICSGMDGNGFENGGCDPYFNDATQIGNQGYGVLNPRNTLDISSSVKMACDGKGSCQVNIPKSEGICGQSAPNKADGEICNGKMQVIGTYYCSS